MHIFVTASGQTLGSCYVIKGR